MQFLFCPCYIQYGVREKNKVKLAFAIPTGAPKILVNEMIDTPPLIAPETIKPWSI